MSIVSNLLKDFGTASKVSLNTAGRVTEPSRIRNLRTAFAKIGPRAGLQPGRVRGGGSAINDIISENARVPGAYTGAPFKASRTGVGSSGIARERVKLAARTQERKQQRLMRQAADARNASRGRAYAKVQSDLSEGYIDSPTAISRNKNIAAADAAITQQDKMDVARNAGQMTGQEWKRQNSILMARRKRAGI